MLAGNLASRRSGAGRTCRDFPPDTLFTYASWHHAVVRRGTALIAQKRILGNGRFTRLTHTRTAFVSVGSKATSICEQA